jgi:hypothetical protein
VDLPRQTIALLDGSQLLGLGGMAAQLLVRLCQFFRQTFVSPQTLRWTILEKGDKNGPPKRRAYSRSAAPAADQAIEGEPKHGDEAHAKLQRRGSADTLWLTRAG